MEIPVFIQYIQGKCQRPADLRRLMERWQDELSPTATGWLGGTYGFANNTDTFCAVVRFESREKAMENSSRREQDQRCKSQSVVLAVGHGPSLSDRARGRVRSREPQRKKDRSAPRG